MFIDFEFQLKLPWLFRQKEDSIITWVGFWAAWVDFDVALSGNPQNVPFHIYVVPLLVRVWMKMTTTIFLLTL